MRLEVGFAAPEATFEVWRFSQDYSEHKIVAQMKTGDGFTVTGTIADVTARPNESYVYLVQERRPGGEAIDHGGTTVGPFFTSSTYLGYGPAERWEGRGQTIRTSWGRLRARYH